MAMPAAARLELGEALLHACQRLDPAVDVGDLRLRRLLHLARTRARVVAQLEQLGHFLEREAERLGPANETQPAGSRLAVLPVAGRRALSRREQPEALVVAQRSRADPDVPGEFPDGDGLHRRVPIRDAGGASTT